MVGLALEAGMAGMAVTHGGHGGFGRSGGHGEHGGHGGHGRFGRSGGSGATRYIDVARLYLVGRGEAVRVLHGGRGQSRERQRQRESGHDDAERAHGCTTCRLWGDMEGGCGNLSVAAFETR